MIFSALLSFLGGSAARAVIGQVIDWLTKRQDHEQELDRIREQEKIDQGAHQRSKEMVELQAKLGIEQIQLAGAAAVSTAEAQAFVEAQKTANVQTGVRWIDGWNGSIRPAAASLALALWMLRVVRAWFELTDWDTNLIASVLGYYFADRHLGKSK